MRRRYLWAIPLLLLAGAGVLLYQQVRARTREVRIVDREFFVIERQTGRRLFAPTWLPPSYGLGTRGTVVGEFRILIDYESHDRNSTLIVAQEQRNPERDAYNVQMINRQLDLKTQIHGGPAWILRGQMGDRRVVWATDDSWIIIASSTVEPDQLLRVARSVTDGTGAPEEACVPVPVEGAGIPQPRPRRLAPPRALPPRPPRQRDLRAAPLEALN